LPPKITIARTAQEMAELRPLWEDMCRQGVTTIFQDFYWNLLALTTFIGREEPCVVCARASYGVAIVPAAVRHSDGTLRLLGEELFDYRCFLHQGDDEALACALAELAVLDRPLEVVALREVDRHCHAVTSGLNLTRFSAAPQVRVSDVSSERFGARHGRLARNLRRLKRLGFEMQIHGGEDPGLLRLIYQSKASQDPASLFHDPLRVGFIVNVARLQPHAFEIFTLESDSRMAAALVTLRDGPVRRLYTVWFDPHLEKYSPAISLIHEVTQVSLAAGLDCDYMTGEQPYKLRMATSSMPLYRLRATPAQLAGMAEYRKITA
jgi:CelD/BcsL family acetyltransferase involved in cellulose biosynthesis